MNKVRLIAITKPSEVFYEENIVTVEDLVAYCAKVSNPAKQDDLSNKEKLIKYLIDHKHWSPFEMANAVLEIETTRDIARQILRHRSFSFQEFSQRYSDQIEFSDPINARLQDLKNRQNSIAIDNKTINDNFKDMQKEIRSISEFYYRSLIEAGVAKELARKVLPEGLTMSRMYMNGTIRSWIHYCQLRRGNGTQQEHIDIANKCWDILCEEIPILRYLDE